MPAGLTKRIYKKRYKAALTRIADKIQAAFSGKKDTRRWISQVTCEYLMQTGADKKGGRSPGGA